VKQFKCLKEDKVVILNIITYCKKFRWNNRYNRETIRVKAVAKIDAYMEETRSRFESRSILIFLSSLLIFYTTLNVKSEKVQKKFRYQLRNLNNLLTWESQKLLYLDSFYAVLSKKNCEFNVWNNLTFLINFFDCAIFNC